MRDSIKNKDAVVYMDGVIISSKSIDEGVQKLKRVLEVAHENGLRINWSKCQVLKRKVNFLGYFVENGTIKPGNEKTHAVADFPIPRDKKGVHMTMKKKEIPLRVSRWAMYLQDFDYEIKHRSGSKMRHVCFIVCGEHSS